MSKKWLFIVILVLTIFTIGIIVVLTYKTRYNKLVINENKWNEIISNRNTSTSIILENIVFNDYNLLIDEENKIIYYSVVDVVDKYNPSVKYQTNENVNIAINDSIKDEYLEKDNALKIMLYNDVEYVIYTLVTTNYPILNIKYNENTFNKTKISMELELFDNYVAMPQRVLKSKGNLRIIEENKEYSFSLIKESLGRNKRDNYISIFGMEKKDEYIIKKTLNTNKEEKYVMLFINNKYNGIYSFGPKEERGDNYERNRANNK